MNRRILALSFLCLGVGSSVGCQREWACSTAGCESGATLELALPKTDWSTVRTWSLKVCRNSKCATGSMSDLPPSTYEGVGRDLPMAGAPAGERVTASVWQEGKVTLHWKVDQPTDGDRFTVEVDDAAGTAIASLDRVATYAKVAPNGEECGPVCRQATLD